MGTAKLSRRSPEATLTTIDREAGRSRLAMPVPEALARIRPEKSNATTWKERPGAEIVNRFPSTLQA